MTLRQSRGEDAIFGLVVLAGCLAICGLGYLACQSPGPRLRAKIQVWDGDRVSATVHHAGPILIDTGGDGPGRVLYREAATGRFRELRGVISIGSED